MTFFKEAVIAELLKKNNISQYYLSNYYVENEKTIEKNLSSIFSYTKVEDIEYLYLLLELKYPDSYEKIFEYFYISQGYIIDDFNIDNKETKKLELLALLAYDNDFYANAINWCAFTKFEMESKKPLSIDQTSDNNIISSNCFWNYFSYDEEFGMSASSDEEAIKEIGKKEIIENCGEFWITGHEENGVQITTFHFKFYNPKDKLTVSINYRRKDDEDCSTIKLNSADLKEGKTILKKDIENLNYEKGFVVDLYISKN